jgi:hypothetical protein
MIVLDFDRAINIMHYLKLTIFEHRILNGLLSNLVSVALATHIVLGCCCHHAHAEPVGGGCQDGRCVFAAPRPDSTGTTQPMEQPLAARIDAASMCQSAEFAISDSFLSSFALCNPSLRLHLIERVLLL